MVFLDLRDAYLQVLFHPDNRKYFRIVASGRVYQFKALCFVLSTMPQFFTRVMAPVSAMLHRADICICRFLDDWLIQAASRVQVLQAWDAVLQLCQSLGIVFNLEKSHLEPVQSVGLSRRPSGLCEFQGFACPEACREASHNRRRIPFAWSSQHLPG